MTITKNSVVFFRYTLTEHEADTDVGVVSKIVGPEYWSAWQKHYEFSWCSEGNLCLIGPPVLGVFNNEGN